MESEIIFSLYPNVTYILEGVAYDVNDQVVNIDQSVYDAEVARLAQVQSDKDALKVSAIQKLATAAGLIPEETALLEELL